MKTSCPTCGAEVEFRYDDSFVRVCAHCRAAVIRGDRGAETLGRFADLAPFDSPLRLFAEGKDGAERFLLVGMAQIRQASGGLSQEWYARFGGRWGWLAEGQGRYYLTFEVPGTQPPPFDTLRPGAQYVLANRTYTVGERGEATYVAATGELPFRLAVNATYRFVDLADGEGGFATIDFNDGSEPPTIYAGRQVTLAELAMSGGETAAPAAPVRSKKLSCPSCAAPIELRAADRTKRIVCAHCSGLVDLEGEVPTLLRQVKPAKPLLPLGKTGTFAEGEMTIIGYVARSAQIGQEWYGFDEYLLYAPAIGFRWLVCSDGHWSYVQPVAQGAVSSAGGRVTYDGVTFSPYQRSTPLRVETVLGEAYWPVTVGEVVNGEDYIAPPAMLSCEVSPLEETWSLATYLTVPEVVRAFGDKDLLVLPPLGVGANQPYPFTHLTLFAGLGLVALMVVAIAASTMAKHEPRFATTITVPTARAPAAARPKEDPPLNAADLDAYMARQQTPPPAEPTEEPPATTFFSEPFDLKGGQNVEIVFSASNLDNNWAYVAADLVEVATGTTLSFDDNLEYYSGVDGGEAWTEGSRDADRVIGPVPGGQYILRLEAQQGGATALGVHVGIAQGVFRLRWLLVAFGVLGLPAAAFALHHWSFNRKRWANSSDGVMAAAIAAASGSDD